MPEENEIGLRATLDVKDFEAGKQKLDAMIANLDKHVADFENRRKAKAAAAAAAEEESTKRITDAATKGEKAQSQAIDRTVSKFKAAAYLLAGITAGIIVAYKQLKDAATEMGDTELVAQFDAIDASVAALSDTVNAVGLEFLKVSDILSGVTGVIEAMRQVIIMNAAALQWFIEVAKGLTEGGFQIGIKGLGTVGIGKGGTNLGEILKNAREKSDRELLALAQAPQTKLATTQAAEREKEAAKEREKNSKSLADYINKIRDLQIKSGESLLSAEKDYQDKSASAWQSYIEKVSDIVAEGVKKRAALLQTYNDAIASAERDYQRGAEAAEYNHSKRLADIERDYQDTVRNIQQTYQEDALDAVRNLDAIALIRAREKRDKDLANAAQTRDRANADEQENYARTLAELQRALEDKKREAEDAYRRGLEDQRRAEQEATQEAKDALNQQNADAKSAYDQRLADINQAYANERAAAQAQYLDQENALRAHLAAMQAIMAQYGIGGGTPTRKVGGPRAEGGIDVVNTPTQFTAGEAGPEMAMFIPLNRALPSPVMQTVNHTGDFSHSIDAAINSSVAGLDGRIMAAVRRAIGEVVR